MLGAIVVLAALLLTAPNPAQAQSTAHPPAAAPSALAANQFTQEQAAKSHCPSDTVVWVNLSGSKAYHASGDRFYGKTRQGAYMCRKDADQAGFHAAGQRGRRSTTKSGATPTSK
ncbi:MAG TPA: hypothetical protein VFQ82_01930 [Stellaceae bacterium]|nr:hypothetical protein [Stellaceae bacterium]